MRRREFIKAIAGSAAAWPLAASAQQPTMPIIGFLGALSASDWATRVEALRAGLRDLGYVEGKNIAIEFRWAEGNYDRLPTLVADLVRLKVNVIVNAGNPGCKAGHHHNPNRFCGGRRCRWVGCRVQPRAAGRELNRIDVLPAGTHWEAARVAQGNHARPDGRRHSVEYGKSNE